MADRLEDLSIYPGGDLVAQGIEDLSQEIQSIEGLLVLVARPRLIALGFEIGEHPEVRRPVEHVLYETLEDNHPRGAHSRYNALLRRIASFANAYKRRSEGQPKG